MKEYRTHQEALTHCRSPHRVLEVKLEYPDATNTVYVCWPWRFGFSSLISKYEMLTPFTKPKIAVRDPNHMIGR